MAITRIAQSGPAAAASGNLTISWSATPAAGDLLVLNVMAATGQSFPSTISGWTTVATNGSGAGFVAAQYTRVATGSETGSFVIMTATVASIAWITQYHTDQSGKAVAVKASSYGADTDDGATGIQTTSLAALSSAAGNWLEVGTVWASSSPSFPTAPIAAASRAITQTGATLGTIQNRASATWLTNYRYNLSDIPVTTGASATAHYASNTTTASLRGLTAFSVLGEVTVNTPPQSTASVPSSAASGATYTTTDTSTVTTSGATIVSRTWRIVSGGGSLSSTTAASITVTAPTGPATQVIGIIATDSNGLSGSEATYSVAVAAPLAANAGPNQTVDAGATVQLNGSANGTTFSWRQVSGPTVTLSSTTILTPTFRAPATITGDTVVLGLTTSSGATTSPESTVDITLRPQTEWHAAGGTWHPMNDGMI